MLVFYFSWLMLIIPAYAQTIQTIDKFHDDGLPKIILHFTEKNNKLELTQKTYYHSNGQKKKEGTYFNGSRDGKWTEWRDDGTRLEECFYENGEKHGIWIHWGKKGKKLREGQYVRGEKDGVWTKYTPNGFKVSEKVYEYGVEVD